ncbi:hypothetical protein ACFYUD_19360 [Nocardia tengchongensis]|uniref:hypothetical protein n=1 Tax=Nocardia tengchongensis TaxID=2055889 RepID=UPI00369C32B7
MSDILDVLQSRWAESAAEAIFTGDEHPNVTLTTPEAVDLIAHITALRHAVAEAAASFERIRAALDQHTAHPEAQSRQACSIARHAAETLTGVGGSAA